MFTSGDWRVPWDLVNFSFPSWKSLVTQPLQRATDTLTDPHLSRSKFNDAGFILSIYVISRWVATHSEELKSCPWYFLYLWLLTCSLYTHAHTHGHTHTHSHTQLHQPVLIYSYSNCCSENIHCPGRVDQAPEDQAILSEWTLCTSAACL